MCPRKMSINFNRNRAQVSFESFIGVTSPSDLPAKRDDFKNHSLTIAEVQQLNSDLQCDAIDFFYNGILSFSEGIDSIFQKRFSWATVKLYYSIYYLIRASLAVRGFALVRCGNICRLKNAVGEKIVGSNNKKYKSTHEGTMNHYKDIFSMADRLLSNKIEDYDAYQWMMNAREIVNYRSVSFLEPNCLDIWDFFSTCVDDGTLATELKKLEDDNYVKCFQEEFAVVAIPIMRMKETIADMASGGLLTRLTHDRETFAKTVLNYDHRSLSILSDIFRHGVE